MRKRVPLLLLVRMNQSSIQRFAFLLLLASAALQFGAFARWPGSPEFDVVHSVFAALQSRAGWPPVTDQCFPADHRCSRPACALLLDDALATREFMALCADDVAGAVRGGRHKTFRLPLHYRRRHWLDQAGDCSG